MSSEKLTLAAHQRFPPLFIVFAILISVGPFILGLLGVNFGSKETPFDASAIAGMSPQEVVDGMFVSLSGGVTHTFLETSAVLIAFFVMLLALLRYKATGDITTPVIGLALLFSGVIDGFHVLAADRIIETTADTRNLVPFTWAVCRVFNSVIMIVGVSIFLLRIPKRYENNLLWSTFILYSVAASTIIYFCLTANEFPQILYPENKVVTRPFDVFPLILFLVAFLFVYVPFYKKYPGIFSQALLLSALPDLATQFHMAFGSSELYDHHFNAAHFLKLMSYVLPLAGLCLDYIRTQENLVKAQTRLIESEKMAVLGKLSGVVAHELRNPLNAMRSSIYYLKLKFSNNDERFIKHAGIIERGITNSDRIITDILGFSRLSPPKLQEIDINQVIRTAMADSGLPPGVKVETRFTEDTISIPADSVQLGQVFTNICINAVQAMQDQGTLEVTTRTNKDRMEISFTDNGPGMDKETQDKVFEALFTTKTKGTGLGLAVCQSLVRGHGGEIMVSSRKGYGATFTIQLPLKQIGGNNHE